MIDLKTTAQLKTADFILPILFGKFNEKRGSQNDTSLPDRGRHAHAIQPDGRDFEPALAKHPLFQVVPLLISSALF